MGVLTQGQTAYSPLFNGSIPKPTLVNDQSEARPSAEPNQWRIELRRYPILHRGMRSSCWLIRMAKTSKN
jgi:hypothetical protein